MNKIQCDIKCKPRFLLHLTIALSCVFMLGTFCSSFAAQGDAAAASNDVTERQAAGQNGNSDSNNGLPAANYTEDDFMPQVSDGSYAWDIIKMIIILGIMVGGFYYFFKFVSKKTGINVHGEDMIQILASSAVGQNKYIQIIDVAGSILVLGITDGNINLITEITNREQIEHIRILGADNKPAMEGNFQDLLKERIAGVVKKISERKNSGEQRKTFEDFERHNFEYLQQQKGRLKDLDR